MPAVQAILPDETIIRIPEWVKDNASFLRWAESEEAPQQGKMGFIEGTVRFDNTMELILHNLIKQAIAQDILNWNRVHRLGHYYGDGLTYSNAALELTTVPDGIYIRKESLSDGTVARSKGLRSALLTGSPDMILEVVSRSSVTKDLKDLKRLYFEAGVKEYWLVDSRVDEPVLQILKRGASTFEEVPTQDGWVISNVLQGQWKLQLDIANEEVQLLTR
jgi:Uma2 family endonuclease